jgi:SAM-dependent methyltransferase
MDAIEDGHLERIRRAELESIRDYFRTQMRVLEIGGGSGFQAAVLSSWGCNVVSIDVAGRKPAHKKYFPVQDYDGKLVPFADLSFDIVFSSNVFEHVQSLLILLKEMKRVLMPDGVCLHVLPSPSWRLWTSLTHYIYAVRWLLGIQPRVPGAVEPIPIQEVFKRHGVSSVIKQLILAGAHGEYPNAASEI